MQTRRSITDEFVFPCREVSVTFTSKLTCFAFASILIIRDRDIKKGHTALRHICLIGRVQGIIIIIISTGLISRKDFDAANDAVREWADLVPALASDLAGDPLRDPLPLPDSELDPDELDELEQLPFDPCPDADSSSEEESDCERCREGDLARLHLDGEWTAEEEVSGGASASFLICVGSVEVEVDGPALTLETVPPPVLWMIASFKTSVAFLQLSKDREACKIHAMKPQPGLGISFRA